MRVLLWTTVDLDSLAYCMLLLHCTRYQYCTVLYRTLLYAQQSVCMYKYRRLHDRHVILNSDIPCHVSPISCHVPREGSCRASTHSTDTPLQHFLFFVTPLITCHFNRTNFARTNAQSYPCLKNSIQWKSRDLATVIIRRQASTVQKLFKIHKSDQIIRFSSGSLLKLEIPPILHLNIFINRRSLITSSASTML